MTRRKAKNGAPLKWISDHAGHSGDDCLIWPFSRLKKGYPAVVWPVKGARSGVYACRYMCELAHGPAPTEEHDAAHSCGNGKGGCINPKHLRWATPAENEADKILHGTKIVGIGRKLAKLNDEKVRAIRVAQGSQQTVADQYGVSRNAIRQILNGRTWSHVQ